MADLSLRHTSHSAGDIHREAASWIERLARFGYAAKGAVYALVGFMAVHAALDSYNRADSSRGALWVILTQPLGRWLLAAVALGLFGYVIWRLVAAVLDPEHTGTDAKGLAKRAGYLISGVLYGTLGWQAVRMVTGKAASAGNGGNTRAEDWTALVMAQPLGVWLIGLVGAGVIGFGIYELRKAYTADLSDRLNLSDMSDAVRTWTVRLARFGLAARGVVFGLIGAFLARAALLYNPDEAAGLGEALRTLERQPYGPWLLAAVGAGMVAYGLFEVVKARYRRIRPA